MDGHPSMPAINECCGMCHRTASVGDILCAEHRLLLGGTGKPTAGQVCVRLDLWCCHFHPTEAFCGVRLLGVHHEFWNAGATLSSERPASLLIARRGWDVVCECRFHNHRRLLLDRWEVEWPVDARVRDVQGRVLDSPWNDSSISTHLRNIRHLLSTYLLEGDCEIIRMVRPNTHDPDSTHCSIMVAPMQCGDWGPLQRRREMEPGQVCAFLHRKCVATVPPQGVEIWIQTAMSASQATKLAVVTGGHRRADHECEPPLRIPRRKKEVHLSTLTGPRKL